MSANGQYLAAQSGNEIYTSQVRSAHIGAKPVTTHTTYTNQLIVCCILCFALGQWSLDPANGGPNKHELYEHCHVRQRAVSGSSSIWRGGDIHESGTTNA
jgi:hypothetical protein